MKDENKTRSQLIDELQEMRNRVADLQRNSTVENHEKVRAEALRESEERLRLALDAANDGIWDWDPGTGRTYFSPRYYTMLGYAPDEFPPMYESWRRLIHPDDVKTAEAAVQRALEEHTPFAVEFRMKAKNGAWHWILGRGKVAELDAERKAVRVVGSHTDITEHKRTAEALEKRIVALTRPLEDVEGIAFEDLFNLADIQHLQDLYAEAFGVAALITRPDGTPITRPSNFTVLCGQFIRNTEKGSKNCTISDALIGRHNPAGPIIQPCLSAGLCNAGASITVGGRHIANWLIGQVRNENQKEEDVMAYARELGADESAFRAAYRQVPVMSEEQFERVANVVFAVANQLSVSAYQNIQQARFITERKQTEESLRLTQFIFDKAPIGIWRMGPDGEVLDVNEAACASLGYTREAFCRMTAFDVAPGFTPADWESGTTRLNEAGTITIEAFHQRKGGEMVPVQVIAKLMRFEGQEYHLAFVQDISERKQAEENLRKNERLLANILESMNEGVFVLDSDFKVTIYNRGMEVITNVPRASVIGKRPWEAFPHIKKLPVEENIRNAMKGEVAVAVKTTHPHNPNVWSRDSFSSIKDADGGVVGVVGVLTDITRQKQAEEELRQLRNYLSNIIDSMPSILVAVDRDGKVTQWNRQTEKTTGLSFEKARFQPLAKVFPRLSGEMDRIGASIRERRVISSPKVTFELGNEIRYEDITIFPLVGNGVEGAVIRLDDVTQQVRLEEMMIQSEKMLSVGGLAAGMAHEINNPLAGILQNASVLRNRLMGDLPANRQAAEAAGITLVAIRHYLKLRRLPDMIDGIHESVNRAADIVRNMLSFARKSDRIVSRQDLGALLDRALDLVQTDYSMKKHYDFKHIYIDREYDPAVPPVPCEAGKLQQVFMNILKNGAEAMAGVTDASASPTFVLRIRDDGNWVRVEIEDNGPGMDEKTRRRIFEPFFTTKPVGQGTGLGLSVSYFIITEDHGGEMRVHATAGGGTCFVIRFPKTGKSGT
ncbi:PAS domain S-box protein [Desulfosarcina ovata]|nr:PAS domain S-box protein [Desulfosarcina ovata]